MYKIILTKKQPQYTDDALTFVFDYSDASEFLKLVETQGYWITYINTDLEDKEDDKAFL